MILEVSRDLGKTSIHPVPGPPKQVNVAAQQHPGKIELTPLNRLKIRL
jgi:hypothetical protein